MSRVARGSMLPLAVVLAGASAGTRAEAPVFFDDFPYADAASFEAAGWTRRSAPGHPGVPGATWDPAGITFVDDPDRVGQTGSRLLRLTASTDGTPAGTRQAQVCHRRKLQVGTWSARVRLRDDPRAGADGDPVIESFYAVGELRFPLDPAFSEVDWEYLPNGGWGAPGTRLYGLSWQTVQVDPWLAFNAPHEEPGSHAGWHQLTMQVEAARVRLFVDDRLVSTPDGRDVPATPMAIAFNLWFSPGGLMAPTSVPRVWDEDVDWVLHLPGESASPAEAAARVAAFRARGVGRVDTVPEPVPALPFRCDL